MTAATWISCCAVRGLSRIDASRLADLEDALRDSTIPFLVEMHDWACLPDGFHAEIERRHVVLVRGARGA